MTITATVIDSKHAVLTTPTGVREINHDDVRVKLVEALREEASTAGTRVVVEIEDHLDQKWLKAVVDPNGAAVVKDHSRPYDGRHDDVTTEVALVDATTEVGVVDENTVTPDNPTELRIGKRVSDEPAEITEETAEKSLPRRRADVDTVLYPEQELIVPESGWRGSAALFGIRLKPSLKELARRSDIAAVSQHWSGTRTVLIASPKGAANKTPTTALLASIFGRRGGAGVVAWDNNMTRGTLPWRTEKGSHSASVVDLLKNVEELMKTSAKAGDMAAFLHHQPADRYDVLWSDQSVDSTHKVSGEEFHAAHGVLSKHYRMMFIDSGNGEIDENFIAAVEEADQLVVPVVASKDVVEGAERMLDRLHGQGGHSEMLAQNAISIVSQRNRGASVDMAVKRMEERVKDLAVVPFDESLVDGMIWFDALTPASQRAWEHAAAVVARSL